MSEALWYSNHMAEAPPGGIDRARLALIAVERSHMAMVISDPNQPDNPIILANPAFLALTGYTAEDIIGRNCRFMQGPDTSPESIAIIRDALAREIDVTEEMFNYRKDGSAFWNRLHISPIHDDSGKLIYFFASQCDVTSRRRAADLERSEQLLLKEIDHRAKNALALVQGIVRLSRSDDARHYATAVQGRVHALANAHTLLAVGNWQRVPLEVLLRSELVASGAGRVEISGPEVAVDVPQVQPVALVLHEIVSNAVKHGSLSSPTGLLDIRWHADHDGVAIDFAETGGPPTLPPATTGFGLSIAETIVSKQLNGRLQLDWNASGLHSRLTIPNMAMA
ncbi:PAS domain-containing protein [Sandarakinorhabdus sp. DWP1-3-1]|uniref:blue-light-activated histidine kinase n=1 Tax=Sandarakinorhabdus sp. DWP1-3-1 TaxID=2804627 RepID=UPI003CF2F4B8